MSREESIFSPHVLIAPLDWGLGHATRCIPLVKTLVKHYCRVTLAGELKVESLLRQEFPQLPFLHLKGYRVRYSASKLKMPFLIAAQVPKILSAIKEEHHWLKIAAQENGFHGIISDNRYGLYHEALPSVFITHQLLIKTPFGTGAEKMLQELNYQYIQKFSHCWVPDHEGEENLAGALSHPLKLPDLPLTYLGPLSRFNGMKNHSSAEHILILLSGPEPQRSMLEEKCLNELKSFKEKVVLVRGIPGESQQLKTHNNIEVHNHLPAAELLKKIAAASFIIARCGYSTIMDIHATGTKAVFIPTPGQPEQEYLAEHLMKSRFALCITQDKFRLKQAIDLAKQFNYQPVLNEDDKIENTILNFIAELREKNKGATSS
ncbi:MAG: glycosyl transferase family 28 [Flavisolibacter sp.]|nr:glycosyl transferase family 28 [Flavisolibacter sp.]